MKPKIGDLLINKETGEIIELSSMTLMCDTVEVWSFHNTTIDLVIGNKHLVFPGATRLPMLFKKALKDWYKFGEL